MDTIEGNRLMIQKSKIKILTIISGNHVKDDNKLIKKTLIVALV